MITHCVERSLEKVEDLVTKNQNMLINFVTLIVSFEGLPTVQQEDRYLMLVNKIQDICKKRKKGRLKYVDTTTVTYEDELHPDEGGTIDILSDLQVSRKQANLGEKHHPHQTIFWGVKKLSRWGCKTCLEEEYFEKGRCAQCLVDLISSTQSMLRILMLQPLMGRCCGLKLK